jgi:hypothetical protein
MNEQYMCIYIQIYMYVNVNKNTCKKCLVAISSFDGWLNNTQEVSIENNFILIPEISLDIYIYIYIHIYIYIYWLAT